MIKWVKLGDIIKITSGGTPLTSKREYYESGTIPWVKTGDLKVFYLSEVPDKISESGLRNSSAKIFPVDTVLLAMYGATIGNCSILKIEAATNQACAAFLPNEKVYPEYLYFYLSSIKKHLVSRGIGGGQPNISATILKETKFPLLPLPDQIRIATLLTRAEALIVQRKESLRLLDELVKGAFLEMFGDILNLGEKKIPLGKVASVVSGLTKGKKYKNQETIFVPYMRVANVQDNFLDLKEVKEIEATVEEVNRYQLKDGDLLLTEGGDPDKLGRGAIWRNEISNCIYQNHIFRVRVVDPNILNPVFLCFLAGSSYGKRYFLLAAKQTTGIASINSTQLKDFPIVLPPLAVQTQFATLVEKAESLKKHYTDSLMELEQLYGSLSQRVFRGELDLSSMEIEAEAPVEEIPYQETEASGKLETLSLGEQLVLVYCESLKHHYSDRFKEIEVRYGPLSDQFIFNWKSGETDMSWEEFLISEPEEYTMPQLKGPAEQVALLQQDMMKSFKPVFAILNLIKPITAPLASTIATMSKAMLPFDPVNKPVITAFRTLYRAFSVTNPDFSEFSKQFIDGISQYKKLPQDLTGLLQRIKNNDYTFEDIWEHEMEGQDYEKMKRILFDWVKGDNPLLEQFFDEETEQIKFRLRETPSA